MTLTQLLDKASIRQAWRDLYFSGCTYQAGLLFVPDRQIGALIGRQFGEALRQVVTDLKIRVSPPAPVSTLPKYLKPSAAIWYAQQARLRGTE